MNRSSTLVLIALVVIAITPTAAKAGGDSTPPVLTSLSFSPTAIDTTNGPATVAVTFSATDDLSGVNGLDIVFTFGGWNGLWVQTVQFLTGASTVSVNATVNVTFPQYSPTGLWTLQEVALFDRIGNRRNIMAQDLVAAGLPVYLSVSPLPSSGLGFYPVAPCRVADTRGESIRPAISGNTTRDFSILSGPCGIPSTAKAYSLNVTVVPPAPLTYLSIWPAGEPQPVVSTLNAFDGAIVANAAIVPAGINGAVSVYVSDPTDLILDINGYFAPPGAPGALALAFYPVTPCRIIDTRDWPLGGILTAGEVRSFSASTNPSCNIPSVPTQAFALNVTVVPPGPLRYLTMWPAGQPQPLVSTLNALDGRVAANAAIVPAGQLQPVFDGATGPFTDIFASDPTNVIIDVNGYFAPPGNPGALWFYPTTPCRIADTRAGHGFMGQFGPPMLVGNASRDFPITASVCDISPTAQAYSLNMTVVPPGPLIYLTTWPSGQQQPVVSTLNSFQGKVVANAAIVPAGTQGVIDVFVSDATDVIIDVNGYFAPVN